MPRRKVTTPEIEAKVCKSFDNGTTKLSYLSELYGFSERTVARVLQKHGRRSIHAIRESEITAIHKLVKAYGLDEDSLRKVLVMNVQAKTKNHQTKHENVVVQFMAALPTRTYNDMLAKIIHVREAKSFNSSVTNAMLQLQNRTNKNGNP